MLAAQTEVKESEVRIRELEKKLEYMSELVREDQLTGSLNRRGLDDIFEREADRSDRRGTSMCIAMLDLDNFKKLNDTYGHQAGDEALVHLVRIVKKTLRSIDVIARYGGEEFVIVMPETSLDESALAMTRVQRELTTHFFTANEQHLFITFSAGVALRKPHEDQDSTVKRADTAMYEAKKLGKNQVVKAE
jgi:diguanylate cyclase